MPKYDNDIANYPPGTVVQYTNRFCRSMGYGPTAPIYRTKGVIVATDEVFDPAWPVVTVQWDVHAPGDTIRVNLHNIARRGTAKLLDNPILKAGTL